MSLLNFVVSDGSTLVATRFVSPDTETPASLYYAEGECGLQTRVKGVGGLVPAQGLVVRVPGQGLGGVRGANPNLPAPCLALSLADSGTAPEPSSHPCLSLCLPVCLPACLPA